jgi:hypothetical protein
MNLHQGKRISSELLVNSHILYLVVVDMSSQMRGIAKVFVELE